ncbi:molybdenum cofactor guanylyltransferase [Marinomonas sp.]|uniref:molybdenum cofactor guanylyltransferase n=1 Tax=Marinomonas sp. TaxID=1904862 RepID=UPI003C76AD48
MRSLSGAVLAGGQAQRMAGVEKGLQRYQGKPMILRVAQAMSGLTSTVVLNVNRQFADYQALGYEWVKDAETYANRGPLSGLWSVLHRARSSHLLVAPCDTPSISSAAFAALNAASLAQPEKIHCLESDSGIHPLHAIMPVESAFLSLTDFLASGEKNSVLAFYRQHGYCCVPWHCDSDLLNVNYQAQLDANLPPGQL